MAPGGVGGAYGPEPGGESKVSDSPCGTTGSPVGSWSLAMVAGGGGNGWCAERGCAPAISTKRADGTIVFFPVFASAARPGCKGSHHVAGFAGSIRGSFSVQTVHKQARVQSYASSAHRMRRARAVSKDPQHRHHGADWQSVTGRIRTRRRRTTCSSTAACWSASPASTWG